MKNIKNTIIKIMIGYLLVVISLTIYQNPQYNLGTKILYCFNILYFQHKLKNTEQFLNEYYLTILIYIIGFYLLVFNQNKPTEKMCLTLISILPHLYYEVIQMNDNQRNTNT